MNPEERKSILLKIDKLFSLATSANQHEAELAAEKAAELLTRYNLSQRDVAKASREFTRENIPEPDQRPYESRLVSNILTQYFFVRCVYHQGAKGASVFDIDEGNGTHTAILGERHNVEIAFYVRSFLLGTFRRLWQEAQARHKFPKGDNNIFYFGVFKGLDAKLAAMKNRVAAEVSSRALVVSKHDAGLDQFVHSHFPRTVQVEYPQHHGSAAALDAGRQAGSAITINRAVRGRAARGGQIE